MKRIYQLWHGTVAAGLLLTLAKGGAAGFQAGTAAVVVTPPLGTPLAGYYHERGAQGVLDDLYAKAVVLDDGQQRIALVACDLISLPGELVQAARDLIETQTGIPGGHVMVSATHQHTGPVLPRQSALDKVTGGAGDLSRRYAAELPGHIARAVVQANAQRIPARLSYAREEEHHLAFNRRFWMKDGSVGWNPGKMNPNMIRPVGPVDPEVGVVFVEGEDKRPVLTYVNFAMHPDTTGGTHISADYPGALSRILALYRGPEMLTLFANGACGNLNHLNFFWPAPQRGTNEANRLGTILAAAVFKAYMGLKLVDDTTLRVAQERVELALPPVSETEVQEARAVAAQGSQAKFMDQVQAYKVLDVMARQGEPWDAEVQVMAMGSDLAWVSLPGEVFVELGLSIKAASPFRQTHVVELANGSIGYIPNRSAYAEGNYEVVSARCAEGSGERLVTAAIRMLHALYREAASSPKAKSGKDS